MTVAHRLIDLVEQAIRHSHPAIEAYAYTLEGNTLLHGEAYYDLENAVNEALKVA